MSTVTTGLAWEGDLYLALARVGLHAIESDRVCTILAKRDERNRSLDGKTERAVTRLAFIAATKIKKQEKSLCGVGASGGEGFDDLRVFRKDGSYFVLSAKNNSKEIYGPRLQKRSPANLPIRGLQDDSYGGEISRIHEMIQPVVGLNWRDVDPSLRTDVYNGACNALQSYLERTHVPPLEIFKRVVGGVDYYMVKRYHTHGEVCGYNLYGGLKCRRIASPTRIVHVDGEKPSYVTAHFNDGWMLEWRIHNRDSVIKTSGLGYSVSILGAPDARYRESFKYDD